MDGSGFNTIPDDLRKASSDVARAVGGVAGFALDSSGAEAYGHDALHTTVADFCSTVRQSVHTCQRDASAAGDALGVAAGAYEDTDGNAGQAITQTGGL